MRLLMPVMLLAWGAALCAAQAQYPRPRRPERFDTAEQISNYLKELQEYYSVHGRGRYGKRQMHIADASVMFREGPVPRRALAPAAPGGPLALLARPRYE